MSDTHAPMPDGEEFLTLRVSATATDPERLMLVGRPRQGRVHIREWTTETMNTAGSDYTLAASELLTTLEHAHAQQRSLGVELYRIRQFLGS